jgi:ABC-type antimicrobial peptide transport system permease subunit
MKTLSELNKTFYSKIHFLKIIAAYTVAGLLITISYLGNFPSSNAFLAWLGTELNFQPLSASYGYYSVNLAFLGLTFFPGLLVTYYVTNEIFKDFIHDYQEEIHFKVKRGYGLRTVLIPFLFIILLIIAISTTIGFLLAKNLLNTRIDYAGRIFANDALISEFVGFSIKDDLANFSIIVFSTAFLYFIISLRHLIPLLRLIRERIEPVAEKAEKPIYKQVLTYFFFTFVSGFFLFELISLKLRIDHPTIVIITILSIAALLKSFDKTLFLILTVIFRYKPSVKKDAPETLSDILKHGWRYLFILIIRIGAPIAIFFGVMFYAEANNLQELIDVIILGFAVIITLNLFFYLQPRQNLIQVLHRITWLKKKSRAAITFSFFTLLFTLIIWQNASYVTISQTGIEEAYFQNYGADLRVGPAIELVAHYGLHPDTDLRIYNSDNRISSVLRYYINTKHSIDPNTDKQFDILMFDPLKYLEGDFYIRDDWFKGGTAEELFTELSRDNSSIILDSNFAKEIKKEIGDKIVLRPHLDHVLDSPTNIRYVFTLIGLVDFFPSNIAREYSVDSEDYKPYGIVNIERADAEFQTPIWESRERDNNPANYWLINTFPDVNRDEILKNLEDYHMIEYSSGQYNYLRKSQSGSITSLLANSGFIHNSYRYYQASGVSMLIYLVLIGCIGFRYLVMMNKSDSDEEKQLFNLYGIGNGETDLVQLFNHVILISFALVAGIVIGSLFTNVLMILLMPPTVTPIVVLFNNYTPALIIYFILIILCIILFIGRILNIGIILSIIIFLFDIIGISFGSNFRQRTKKEKITLIKDYKNLEILTNLIIFGSIVLLPTFAYRIEKIVYSSNIIDFDYIFYNLGVISVIIISILIIFNIITFSKEFYNRQGRYLTKSRVARTFVSVDQFLSLMISIGLGFMIISLWLYLFNPGDVVFELPNWFQAIIWGPLLLVYFYHLLFLLGTGLLLIGLFGLAKYYNVRIRLPKITLSWITFYRLTLKKLLQNRQRLIVLMSGLILALALIAGVSTHVDTVSQRVVNDYFESPDRVTDIFSDLGEHSPEEAVEFLESNTTTKEFAWIDKYSFVQRWHVKYMEGPDKECVSRINECFWEKYTFTHSPGRGFSGEYLQPEMISLAEDVPIITVEESFYDMFENQIIMEHNSGNFTLDETHVVVTRRWAIDNIDPDISPIGLKFRLFDWAARSPGGSRDMNWTSPALEIAGIIDEKSPILEYFFNLGSNYPGFQLFKNVGGIVMLKTEKTYPSFWNILKYQRDRIECMTCPSFESIMNLKIDHHQIDQINPASFLGNIDNFEAEFISYFQPDENLLRIRSPLKGILFEYIRWATAARASLILLSSPVIFLGWYIADFTFKEIYRERRKEVSSLKSRGISNTQIEGMLLLEATILIIVASIIGFTLGVSSNYILEYLKIQSDSKSIVTQAAFVFDSLIQNKPLKDEVITIHISPLTPLLTVLAGLILVTLGAIRPIREVINWPIDEILQTEHEGKITEGNQEVNVKEIGYYLFIGIVGTFFLLSLGTLDPALQTTNLVIGMAILGLGMVFIGLITGMAHLARLIPSLIESMAELKAPNIPVIGLIIGILIIIPKLIGKIFTKYSQWYVISREMRRHSKTTVAAFVVISLTLAFGIISATLISSSADYYERDAIFEIGVNGVRFEVVPGGENAFNKDFRRLENVFNSIPEVENVTSYYKTRGYFLQKQHTKNPDYPSLIMFNMLFNFGAIDPSDVVFIDPTTYFDTGYIFDDFFTGGDTLEIVKQRFNDTLEDYDLATNPILPVIIDKETARVHKLEIYDTFYFAAARIDVFRGRGNISGIADSMPPGLTKSFVVVPRYSTMWRKFSINNPTTGFLVKTTNLTAAENLKTQIIGNSTYFPISSASLPSDYLAEQIVALELSTLTQIMNLDLLYSIILAGIGFLLILEFRTAQKSKEIGILKAIGFGNIGIITLVFVEAVVIIVVAIFTGFFVGWIGGTSLTMLLPNLRVEKIVLFPQDLIIYQVLVAVIFALIGSLIASVRANRHKISLLIK